MDEIQRSGGTLVNYDYDTLGRRVFREIPAQLRFIQSFYEYDGADRLTRVLNKTLRPTGGEEEPEFEWGFRGIWKRLKRWANRPAWAGTGITISDFTYTYDDVDNRLTMSVDGGTHTYSYDPIYQLTSVSGAQSHSYDYDDVGNRVEVGSIDYTANNLNQYTVVNSVNFDYDAKGNLIDDGVNTYRYDLESRLDSVITGSATVTFEYDPFGRRQMMSVNGTETFFIYDGDHVLAEYDGSGNLKREYIYGANLDEVVSLYRASPSARYFYYQDGLGSISEILDANGVLAEQYEYEPYGKTTIKNKTGSVISTSAMGNRFAFTGRCLDYETKLYDYRARVYSTEIGRFLQRDPVWQMDETNQYTYVRNNPATLIDPYGELWWVPILIGGGVSAGADLISQLAQNEWNWKCVDAAQVGGQFLLGAGLGSLGPGGIFLGRGKHTGGLGAGMFNDGVRRFGWSGPVNGRQILQARWFNKHLPPQLLKVRDAALHGTFGTAGGAAAATLAPKPAGEKDCGCK